MTSLGWNFPVPTSHWVVYVRGAVIPQAGWQETGTLWQCASLLTFLCLDDLGTSGGWLLEKRESKMLAFPKDTLRIFS